MQPITRKYPMLKLYTAVLTSLTATMLICYGNNIPIPLVILITALIHELSLKFMKAEFIYGETQYKQIHIGPYIITLGYSKLIKVK